MGYSPQGGKESDTTEQLSTHTHITPKSEHRIWSQKLNSVSPQLSLSLTHRHCLLNE